MPARADPATASRWSRTDAIGLFARLTDGFVRSIPVGGSPAAACLPGSAAGHRVPSIEGFARMSVAWASWLHEPSNPAAVQHRGRRHDIADLVARGLTDATDPRHPAWWGPIGDRDQRIVEAAEIATALLLGGARLRTALAARDPRAEDRILDWLGLVDGRDVWPDNWILFPMVAGLARRAFGRTVPDAAIDDAIDWMLAHHVGDGWSSDGAGHALDLYAGWAIHWHLLWWARFDGGRRPGRRAVVVRRARAWLAGVAPLVAADGSYARFGRSLGYRFAFAAPFVQGAFLGIDPLEPGGARRVTGSVIRAALERDAIDPATDWFRVGVGGERPAVVEGYVTAGAAAWAAHALLALAMPATHAFWSAPEATLPADRGVPGGLPAGRAGLLVSWTADGDTRLHNARSGHPADIVDHDYAATYGKLVYRSAFPCDVPTAAGAGAGSDDAVTAMVPATGRGDARTGAVRIVHRAETDAGSAGPGWIVARYGLATGGRGLAVTTVVIVLGATEVRVSLVGGSAAPIRIRDGGPVLDGVPVEIVGARSVGCVLRSADGGLVGTRSPLGGSVVRMIDADPDRTNLLHGPAPHLAVEEIEASSRRRLVGSIHASRAPFVAGREDPSKRASALTTLLTAIDVVPIDATRVSVTAPGLVAVVDLGARPGSLLELAGHTVRGPGLTIVRAASDASSFGGERIAEIDGVVALDRPGVLAIERAVDGVDLTTAGGVHVDPAWAGRALHVVAVRRGAGPFEHVTTLDEPGVVPDGLVRRLARACGTHLVDLRLAERP